MSKLRLLIVEDNQRDLRSFRNSVNRYIHEKKRRIESVECQNLDEALKMLDNSFDGAIIDLKLTHQGDEGNQVIAKMIESFYRIPVAIFTGNRGSLDENLNEEIMLIDVFIKGATGYDEILDKLWDIYNTGLTRIMGGRELIEQTLNEVSRKNLFPQIETWISYGAEDPERTEKALLRYTLNHLFQLLEEDGERCFPEEFYLYPPMSKEITTGSIVKEETSDKSFVTLSPACDLVIRRNGEFKTDRILLVEIESEDNVVNAALDGITRTRSKKNKLRDISNNNHTDYYHWLPEAYSFDGGFLNFRKLRTLDKTEFNEKFEKPLIQISPFFVKDIVSRFSSFYARQGQPDIDSEDFINRYTT